MKFDPASAIQDFLAFGEFGGVNPSITDSSTYTFLNAEKMEEMFQDGVNGCFLYSRHWNPSNKYLAQALARMEDGQSAQVMASGMAAISLTFLLLCSSGEEIVSSRTIYGGTYALLKNLLPRFGITTRFVDVNDAQAVRRAITPKTRLLFCESISNPLLQVSDIAMLGQLAKTHGINLVVDNTFSPLILSPLRLGADVVVHSLTKFVNGTSDCVAGAVISSESLIKRLTDLNSGPSMLLGPVLGSIRAAQLLKNLHSLHIRMKKHGENALYLATHLEKKGLTVYYPGLKNHADHRLLKSQMNAGFGFGGILAFDAGDKVTASKLMTRMQEMRVGYLAVSLGYFKNLFSAPGHSTSSEIPAEERLKMGITEGLVRFSVGLDNDMMRTCHIIDNCLKESGIVS